MGFQAICSPRSARLLLTGSVDLPKPNTRKASDVPRVEDLPIYFPGLREVRPWRFRCLESHVDDLRKKLPTVSLSPPVSPGLTVPIPKRAGAPVKPCGHHVSFGEVVVHEVERLPLPVFPPPCCAVLEPKRRSFPLRLPFPAPVEATQEVPRRKLRVEVTVRGPTLGQWFGIAACSIASIGLLSWLV